MYGDDEDNESWLESPSDALADAAAEREALAECYGCKTRNMGQREQDVDERRWYSRTAINAAKMVKAMM